MFINTKQMDFVRVSPEAILELETPTPLSYYIVDPIGISTIASIEYKIDKKSGRDNTSLVPWTSVVISEITDDIYELIATVSGVIGSDTIHLVMRVTDTDGTEMYHTDSEVSVI